MSSIRSQMELLVGGRRLSMATLAGSSVLSGLAEAGVLAITAQLAATLVNGDGPIQTAIGPLKTETGMGTLLGVAAGLAVARLALQVPISYLPARISADVQAELRGKLFGAFTRASWAVQSDDKEGHLQEILTNQTMQATVGALSLTELVTALITFAVLIASALILNVWGAILVLVVATVLFGILRPVNRLGGRKSRELSGAQMQYASGVGEAIRVAEESHVFGTEAAQRRQINRFVDSNRRLFFQTQLLARLVPNTYQSLIFLVVIAGLGVLYFTNTGHMGALGAVVLLLVRAGTYGQRVQSSYQLVRQALPFVERVQRAERLYSDSSRSEDGRPLSRIDNISFDEVCYMYRQGRPVLSDISFKVGAGETVGVIGPSGAGKSTLIQILLQLRAPCSGEYKINGVPASEYSSQEWHRRVAYVPQEPRLLHASVAENIRFFRNLDDDAVEGAARLARIHDDIVGWSHGYDTVVGPRADAVSGGQQQRICLARALAAQPEMLVLDEPTSALDPHSEKLIHESLRSLRGRVTVFIVAHRLAILDICDRVMVIVDGQREAFDSRAVLPTSSAYFRSTSPTVGLHPT